MTIARDSSRLFMSHGLALAAGLVTSIVSARLLGPEGRGVLAVIMVTVNLGALIAGLGLTYSLSYFIAKKRVTPASGVGLALVASAVLGTAAVAVVMLVFPLLQTSFFRGVTPWMVLLGVAALPASLFFDMWYGTRTSSDDFVAPTRMQNTNTVLALAVTVGVLVVLDGGLTLLVAGLTLIAYVISIAALVISLRTTGVEFAFDRPLLREVLKYGFTVYLGSLVNSVYLRVDAYILNAVKGPAQVGQYSTAVSLNERLWMAESSIGQAVLPRVIGQDRGEAARLAALTSRTSFIVTAVPAVLLALLAPWLIPFLYGQAFAPAVLPLQLLLLGTTAYPAGKPLANYFSGQLGRPKVTSTLAAAIAVVSVIAYLLLVPAYGASGAAMGSSLVYGGSSLFLVWLFARETGMSMAAVVTPTREDFAVYRRVFGRVRRALLALFGR